MVEGRLHEATLPPVQLALRREQPLAEEGLGLLDAPALDGRPTVGHEHVPDDVGMGEDVEVLVHHPDVRDAVVLLRHRGEGFGREHPTPSSLAMNGTACGPLGREGRVRPRPAGGWLPAGRSAVSVVMPTSVSSGARLPPCPTTTSHPTRTPPAHDVPVPTLADVEAARELLQGVARRTPLEGSRPLSEAVGGPVHFKCENLQRAGSFKIRGAYNRIARLTPEERSSGVVAASAGNHAQGVALASQLLGIHATVFMPEGATIPKLAATRAYGADVRLHGQSIDDCLEAARAFEAETGAVLIHPFDHADIVAGQGTAGLEILEQCPDVRTIVVCTGGGGLIAGIALAVKSLRPDITVVGVQAETAAAYPPSLAAGTADVAAFHGDDGRRDRGGPARRRPLRAGRRARRRSPYGLRGVAVAGPAAVPRAREARRRAGGRGGRRRRSWTTPRPSSRRWSPSSPAATSTPCCCSG